MPDLRRAVTVGAALLPIVYAGVAAVALMAVPVMATPDGPESELGGEFIEEPILGVAKSFDPAWVSDLMQVVVVIGGARRARLGGVDGDAGLVAPRLRARDEPPDPELAGEAVGAANAVCGDRGVDAHRGRAGDPGRHRGACGDLRVRCDARDRDRARVDPASCVPSARTWRVRSRCRGMCGFGGRQLPVPTLVGFVITGLAWLSVLVYHDEARWVGGGWMAFGLVGYVIYRKGFEGTSLVEEGRGAGRGARKAGGVCRVPGHPGADLRDASRRRHRRDGGAACGCGRERRRGSSRGFGSCSCSICR